MSRTLRVESGRHRAARVWIAIRTVGLAGLLGVALLLAPVLAGCAPSNKHNPRPATPTGPVFSGEEYLHGAIGSMCRVMPYEPLLVSGYGLVILPKGSQTGSSDVPSFLRQWLLNEMRRKGVGSYQFGAQDLSPRQMLASKDTAVVRVEGLIPAGAPQGSTFAVLVTALEGTQTTSLEGGKLWTTDLSIGGDNTAMMFTTKRAEAKGAVYINPFEEKLTDEQKLEFRRQGVVLAGGVATQDRTIELVMNQPSFTRVQMIADRINERYPHENATEFFNTAIAKSDLVIRVNVPVRFKSNPDKLLRLIEHTFVNRDPNFMENKARSLGDMLEQRPDELARVSQTWQAFGRTALPIVRQYYEHENPQVRLAALDAGAWLQDELAASHLAKQALDIDPEIREQAAGLLGVMPKSTRGARALRALVDDTELDVRIAAYESLSRIGDQAVHRTVVGDEKEFKFFIDVVESNRPLVYIANREAPTIVVFGRDTGFREHAIASLWDGRLRMVGKSNDDAMRVFYQPTGATSGVTQTIAPAVANLAHVMGHRSNARLPIKGFDLSYGSVVSALYNLQRQNHILAQMYVRRNPLAAAVEIARRQQEGGEQRPDEAEIDSLPDAATPEQLGAERDGEIPAGDQSPTLGKSRQ